MAALGLFQTKNGLTWASINLRQEYHMVLTQYKDLLTSKKSEYYDTKVTESENSTNNSDQTRFWKGLKSRDDTFKQKGAHKYLKEIGSIISNHYIPINLSISHKRWLLMS